LGRFCDDPSQGALEFGNAGEDRQNHPARWAFGIDPRLIKRLQSRVLFSQSLCYGEKLDGRARQPVETGDDQNILVADLAQKLFKLGTIALGSGDFLLEQFLTTDGQEARSLEIEGLVLGGDAGVPELHAATSGLLQKRPRKSLVSRWLFAKDSALILRRALLLRKTMEFREKWRSRF